MAALASGVIVGLAQWLTGRTAYVFATQTAIVQWATLLAAFLVSIHVFHDEHVRQVFRLGMIWFSSIVAIVGTIQTFSSNGRIFWLFPSGYSDHVMGPFVSPNHYAAFIEAVLPIALYQAFCREKESLLYGAVAAAMYASVIASASRAGVILTTAEILAVVLLLRFRGLISGRAARLSIAKMSAAFGVLVAVIGWQDVWQRFHAADALPIRPELATATLHMIGAHPLSGVGLGTWSNVYPHYAIADIGAFANQAHNDWLQWTAEGGIPLGLILAGLFFWGFRGAYRTIWGLGAATVFIHATVDYPFSRPALGCWIILVLAMIACETSRRNTPRCSQVIRKNRVK